MNKIFFAGLGLVVAMVVQAKVPTTPTAPERFGQLEKAEEPSFRRHILPLFSRVGCSGRECHGAFAGQGGFQLSLFGYDFAKDHKEITADTEEVRVDQKDISKSLVLLKATNQEKHKGKERIKPGSWEYNLVHKWISSGAKNDTEKTGDFDRLEISPKEIVFKKAGEKTQIRVLAYWKDGTVEDVTLFTRFRTNDDSVSVVSATGEVEAKDKGDTHIVAFYDNGVHPIPVMLPVSDKVGASYPKVATPTKVDELIIAKLRKLGVVPSETCTDAEFLRRVSLDLTGTLPTPNQVMQFLADISPNKRTAKVDELLKTPAYSAWWATKMSDFLGNNPRVLRGNGAQNYGDKFSRQWYDWLRHRIEKNEPYDKMMAGIILATGRTKPTQSYEDFAREMSSYFRAENPASFAERPNMPHFWARQNIRTAEEKALAFAHSFLGVRIECAQCHKHPFDQWTQNDFKSFQAFFGGISYGNKPPGKTGDEKVTFASLTKEIREAIPADPKSGNNQKGLGNEFERRVKAGEPAPWQELFAIAKAPSKLSEREIERLKKQNPNFDSRVLTPKILGGEDVLLTEFPDPRTPLMEWLRSSKNPYFARSWVNRVWASYFNRGLVEPADDLNLANPPVNQELMDHLADGFIKNGYSMAWLHREILSSATYQRSWKANDTNKHDEKNFSRFVIRRLPAEVIVDGVAQATLSTDRLASFASDIEVRAIGPNANAGRGGKGASNYSLNIFGKPVRETNCDCERTSDPTLLQTLYLRNDPEFLTSLEQARGGSSWVEEIRRQTSPVVSKTKQPAAVPEVKPEPMNPDRLIEQVFLRTVSRPPTALEFEKARIDFAAAASPAVGVRELLWAMLNTREFMVNH